ncbi:DUF6464 family protein [Halomicronema hongdechloris]|uniref:DUF6464 family protein n=1 Tax=Halomicronema hongdechloris TaxID=1209493 RepID=UPI00211B357C|nr:DUF6464 family protein [Halomicronema hongdechloris]
MPTDVMLNHPCTPLGRVYLDWIPQPGADLDMAGQTYRILERHHRYRLKSGRYQLAQMILYVQPCPTPAARHCHNGQWMIGDVTCAYNARSELLRCAVNPEGPCQGCGDYQSRSREGKAGTEG